MPVEEPSFEELYPTVAFIERFGRREVRRVQDYYVKVRKFRKDVVEPRALEIEKRSKEDPHYVPEDVLQEACKIHLFTCLLPKALGGTGLPLWAMSIISEELAYGCLGLANLITVNGLALLTIAASGDLRFATFVAEKIVEGEKRGEPSILATALTEPSAGSDMEEVHHVRKARISTTVKKVQGGYEVHGTKVFISNGSMAEYVLLITVVDQENPERGIRIFLVKRGMKGFSVGKIEKKMGVVVSRAAELVFDRCFIPDEQVFDIRTPFSELIGLVVGVSRAWVGSIGAGAARRIFNIALNHAFETQVGGKRLIDYQWVQFEIQKMFQNARAASTISLESFLASDRWATLGVFRKLQIPGGGFLPKGGVRFVARRALFQRWLFRSLEKRLTDRSTVLGDNAKVLGSDLAMDSARRAILLMGEAGVRRNWGVEKIYRDSKLLQIFDGTNQACKIDLLERSVFQGVAP